MKRQSQTDWPNDEKHLWQNGGLLVLQVAQFRGLKLCFIVLVNEGYHYYYCSIFLPMKTLMAEFCTSRLTTERRQKRCVVSNRSSSYAYLKQNVLDQSGSIGVPNEYDVSVTFLLLPVHTSTYKACVEFWTASFDLSSELNTLRRTTCAFDSPMWSNLKPIWPIHKLTTTQAVHEGFEKKHHENKQPDAFCVQS